MLTSAPFDNWWHEAYGLDVKIISPPHMLLALGIAGIMWGGAILAASYLNRADGEQRVKPAANCDVAWWLHRDSNHDAEAGIHQPRPAAQRHFLYGDGIGTLLLLEGLARVAGHRWRERL